MNGAKLYAELAAWWPLLSDPASYAEPAEAYRAILAGCGARPPREVLELGSGGGNTASHLKAHFEMTLVDRSEGMLAVSRRLNPECEHVQGDMRDVRLGRTFDAVFVQDAASYLASEDELRAAAETAFAHARPGAVALFCPDHTRESFRPATAHGGKDGADGRALRYLEWTFDPDPADTSYLIDFAFLLREADGSVALAQDRHVFGLFRREDWIRALSRAGFDARAVSIQTAGEPGSEAFVGVRPP